MQCNLEEDTLKWTHHLDHEADQNQAESQMSQFKPVALYIAGLVLELCWSKELTNDDLLQLWEGLCILLYNYITARQLYNNAERRKSQLILW